MWAAPGTGEATWLDPSHCPFTYIFPENLKVEEVRPRNIPPPPRDENHRERKALRQGEICRGNSFPEGEIIAIVIVITLDFIGIIIIHRAITIISAAPLRSAVTSRVVPCLVHWGDSPGVNYSLLLMLLSSIGGLRFMSILSFITISSLIMIHMMSCE